MRLTLIAGAAVDLTGSAESTGERGWQPEKEALVSAIIPTHNRAHLLERAIRSVLNQTYAHIEVIVVDDASSDNTREIVLSFVDSRIRYFRHESNRGGAAARNTGIREAGGEYIAFLDDDDEWIPEKTKEQLKLLERFDAVTCTADTIGDDLAKYHAKKMVELEGLLQGTFTFGGTGVLMARAHVLKQTMFDESLPRYQDWDLFIRIALKHEIAYLNKPLIRSSGGNHRRITNSVLHVPLAELDQQFLMLHKHKDLFGPTWFKRHMCNGLLYGIRRRPDEARLLMYAVRRYGLLSVARALAIRMRMRLRRILRPYLAVRSERD